MRRLGIVAIGLALVVGILVGGIVNNLLGATAQGTSAAAVTGSGCYTNWNSADCAAGYTAVSTGEWTAVWAGTYNFYWPMTGSIVCASPKTEGGSGGAPFISQVTSGGGGQHTVNHEPCAICCATGPSVVGGSAELPAVAGSNGTSGMGGATYAVLAGAAAGMLAFAVLATLSVRKWRVR